MAKDTDYNDPLSVGYEQAEANSELSLSDVRAQRALIAAREMVLETEIEELVSMLGRSAPAADRLLSLVSTFLVGLAINSVTAATIVNFAFDGENSLSYFYFGVAYGAFFFAAAAVFSFVSGMIQEAS